MSRSRRFFRRAIAWPGDHGAWVFLLSPLIIGLVAAGRWTTPCWYLVVAALCGFLIRQPSTVWVKAISGRRARQDLAAASLWSTIYALVGGVHVLGLVWRGFGYLLYLAIPGVAVFAWYLYLVARREERGQLLLELLAAGVLSLTAPAGLWVGLEAPSARGWLLWALIWTQMVASIVYVYFRLEQRRLDAPPSLRRRLRMVGPALSITTGALLAVLLLGASGVVARWLFVAYLPQWLETIQGLCQPMKPLPATRIGYRQLSVSALYTLIFAVLWS